MTDISKWKHKDEWHQRADKFLVVVKHYTEKPFDLYPGVHRWNVYAYIYPKHKLFGEFKGSELFQSSASALPLHGGASLLTWHYDDDGKPTIVQVGSDYLHLYDDRFSEYATPEDAYEVFEDAEKLFDYLARKAD
jgi:hypothetical protein